LKKKQQAEISTHQL